MKQFKNLLYLTIVFILILIISMLLFIINSRQKNSHKINNNHAQYIKLSLKFSVRKKKKFKELCVSMLL